MSVNQSRADKSEAQLRKPGRSGNFSYQRSFSGAGGKGSGSATAPEPLASSSASLSSNRSFKNSNNNGRGNSKPDAPGGNLELNTAVSVAGPLQNGGHAQSSVLGQSDAAVLVHNKPIDTSANKNSRALPKAPLSKLGSGLSDSSSPATPSKGDVSRAFPLQFGSLSPGFMNGMQIPARTSSAPPNLDEQKRNQACQDSITAVPAVPKQQQSRKDMGVASKSNTVEVCSPSQVKRDAHVQLPEATTNQKSSIHPMSGMSMGRSYQQPQGPLQFGGPSAQIQPQGLQSHPLPPQGMMHQSQGLGFATQIGHQMAPQLNNLGMGMAPQFPPLQPGKFSAPRKTTVKITHPDTHEELRLDKRTYSYSDSGHTGPRSNPHMPPQSQPIPSFSPAHPINYYASRQPNAYNPASIFFQTSSSLPLTSTQVTPSSSAMRYNFAVGQGGQSVSFMNPSTVNPSPLNKSEHRGHGTPEHVSTDSDQISIPLPSVSVPSTVKPAVGSFSEKVSGTSMVTTTAPSSTVELPKIQNKLVESNLLVQSRENEIGSEDFSQQSKYVSKGSAYVVGSSESRRKETIKRSDSFKDQQKKPSKRETQHVQHEHQADLSEDGDGMSSSLHKVSRDSNRSNNMTVVNQTPACGSLESLETPKLAGSTSAGPFDHSPDSEDGVSSLVEPTKTGDGKATPAVAETFGVTIDAMEVPHYSSKNDRISIEKTDQSLVSEGGSCEPSNPSGSVDEVATSKCVDSALKEENCSSSIVEKYSEVGCEVSEIPPVDNRIEEIDVSEESGNTEAEQMGNNMVLSMECRSEVDRISTGLVNPAAIVSHTDSSGTAPSSYLSTNVHKDKPDSMTADASEIISDKGTTYQETAVVEAPVVASVSSEIQSSIGSASSTSVPGSKLQVLLEQSKPKATAGKRKKKRKILMKADAAGTTFDLYNAFKGPEEKQQEAAAASAGSADKYGTIESKQVLPDDDDERDLVTGDEDGQSKDELDDWEDVEISTPELKRLENGELIQGVLKNPDGSDVIGKKYSRDFLLTLSKQWTELPLGFEIRFDIADALMTGPVGSAHLVDRDPYPNSGRIIDRSGGGSRVDRRGSMDDDKWSKSPGPFSSGRDSRVDVHGGGVANLRPGQGGSNGVLRHPRGQPSGQHVGGILSGPALYPQGGMSRSSPDANRWQWASAVQKGLISSPQSPLQIMHKADRKYEIGAVSDEEESKQRQLKSILNKLTPQNFDKLFEQVKAVNIDNAATLTGVISQIFDKALMEPTFCEMYANFCFHLAGELPDFNEDNEKITFKRVLLNKCQEEFERGEREQAEADRVEEGDNKQSEEEREEKRIKARRRMLGNIRLIGELYKKKMLTERIMHECIKKLLGQYQNPDEEDVEALCKLMSTIGEMIDHPKAKDYMDAYFDRMAKLSTNQVLSSRMRFMLQDAIDLRKNGWQQRRKVEGPKKIEEVHRDAAQERQLQSSKLSRGPSMGSSARRSQSTVDYGPRGPSLLSYPGHQQMGGRTIPSKLRGYGAQNVRTDDRGLYESRMLSVPLPQRPMDDDSITLGPQGGLGRGMSIRGQQPILSSVALTELSAGVADQRRTGAGPVGHGAASDRHSNPQEESMPRYATDRFVGSHAFDQSSPQNMDLKNPDRRPTSPAMSQTAGSSSVIQCPVDSEISEDKLQDMSIAAIREFYSARNEEEVCLCIKDLKSPGFYPEMVMLWVVDSFDRKNDIDRDVLAKLLVYLCKSEDGLLSQSQLIKGFEYVLATLEDAITDSPKATEQLGRIFSKIILENVVPFREVGRLILEGGEEPGSLVGSGLAADVLVSILEAIRGEKGDLILNEIRMKSNLRLEDFRPLDLGKARKLDAFS
ncbi:eukaryotic translation initiation factor 4G-like isoform X2 [Aristolochia californica]|uniref:eukaryotic translation initiation factor 4G-like isoform X2 n=1 Tax=Aristolochia californica TaxID=171875 RepID=UPI0035D82168